MAEKNVKDHMFEYERGFLSVIWWIPAAPNQRLKQCVIVVTAASLTI